MDIPRLSERGLLPNKVGVVGMMKGSSLIGILNLSMVKL